MSSALIKTSRQPPFPTNSAVIATRPCWALVCLWTLSIAQYGYRYIFQVNDPRTSHDYGSTPVFLSAIKYEIFALFFLYGMSRMRGRQLRLTHAYRILALLTTGSLFILAMILLLRLATSSGGVSDTALCALQLAPWMASGLLVPLLFHPEHSATRTLTVFERLLFWIAFPFWLTTVALAVFGIRYAALSTPGVLLRFGGIIDDPNAYASLCLLLIVLSVAFRAGAWRLRAVAYFCMFVGTISFSGYIMAVVLYLWLLPFYLAAHLSAFRSRFTRVYVKTAVVLCLFGAALAVWASNKSVVESLSSVYEAKTGSTATHITDLLPDDDMMDVSSPSSLLLGTGGFSENFYWCTLVNFGWIGFFSVIAVVALWTYYPLRRAKGWQIPAGAWIVCVLVGSNGIPYLLTFPVSLMYWSLLALLAWSQEPKVIESPHNWMQTAQV